MAEQTYLEYVDEKSSKFWEITLDGAEFTVRYGRIGSDGRENTKTFDSDEEAREAASKLIESKTKKGYAEVSQGAENRDTPSPTQSTFGEVSQRFASLNEPGIQELAEMAEIATIYEGDVVWDGHSITSLAVERGEMGTIIIVDGDLEFTDESVGWDRDQEFENNVLLVTGNLTANGLELDEIGAVRVEGDLNVRALAGSYGDNGGSIDVVGTTTAELIVATTYFVFGFAGGVNAGLIVGDSTYATDWTDDYLDDQEIEQFVDEVIDGDAANESLLVERFLAGQPILKDTTAD